MDIYDDGLNKSLKSYNRNNYGEGVYQDLYIKHGCLQKNERFAIIGKYIEYIINAPEYFFYRLLTTV
jgi:hypothetical protein